MMRAWFASSGFRFGGTYLPALQSDRGPMDVSTLTKELAWGLFVKSFVLDTD